MYNISVWWGLMKKWSTRYVDIPATDRLGRVKVTTKLCLFIGLGLICFQGMFASIFNFYVPVQPNWVIFR
jgi:hypothetical protein